MSKKDEPQNTIVSSSTTHHVKDTDIRATIHIQHTEDSEEAPISMTLDPWPVSMSDWVEVAAFIMESAEAITDARDDDDNEPNKD